MSKMAKGRPARRAAKKAEPVSLVELRVLDGPNLYFTRPAVKLTVSAPGWLEATEERASALAARIELPPTGASGRGRARPSPRPGAPGSQQRRRFVARAAGHLTRSLAAATRTHVAVRARPGPEPGQIVVAFPWRRRGAAEALGREIVRLFGDVVSTRRSFAGLLAEAVDRVDAVDPGDSPSVPHPSIPIVAVTGTNGKTTTVRLLAHLVRTAGKTVAYSSTDGVYLDGERVIEGDYSGFGGAGRALSQPQVEVAVLETARGSILLRGIGTARNDVAVVTNVSADHLDLHGIRTLDQLAEVKATITRITKPTGWDVLNADDPRVLAMRRGISGRPWLISLDHEHPAIRSVLSEGGRAMTVIDGVMTMLGPGHRAHPLVALEEVPLTLAGISSHNTSNAMGAAAAALGIGLPERAVVRGLKTFVLDPETNPGRTNLFELDGRIVVVDYAHNEAGMAGLVETCRGLRQPGAEIWLAVCSAGDRTEEIRRGMGFLAARGADHFVIAELLRYLRGNTRENVVKGLRAGALEAGVKEEGVFEDEMRALEWMLKESKAGDLVGVTALAERFEIFELLEKSGATRIGPKRVKQLVRRARGRPSQGGR